MRVILSVLVAVISLVQLVSAQSAPDEQLRSGINFIPTETYSPAQNERLLKLYKGLRVADVSDGMDMVGLPGAGLVDQSIHASWRDLDSLRHQFCGIALTMRYVPTQRADRPAAGEKFTAWEGAWYGELSSGAFLSIITPVPWPNRWPSTPAGYWTRTSKTAVASTNSWVSRLTKP